MIVGYDGACWKLVPLVLIIFGQGVRDTTIPDGGPRDRNE